MFLYAAKIICYRFVQLLIYTLLLHDTLCSVDFFLREQIRQVVVQPTGDVFVLYCLFYLSVLFLRLSLAICCKDTLIAHDNNRGDHVYGNDPMNC